jgi:hypothetical protein
VSQGHFILRRARHNADVIYEANWRAVKNSIDFLAEKTREKLGATRVDAVIYCVLDNSIYYALTEAGDTRPAKRDADGKYHMEGDLIVSSKSAQHILFKSLRPLLDAAGG